MRWPAALAAAAALLFAVLLALRGSRAPIDLTDVPGRRLVGLDGAACRAALDRAGVAYEALAPRREGPACGYADGIRFEPGGSRNVALSPGGAPLACPLAAALAAWEWRVVQPAALRSFGTPVAAIEQLGTYNCRPIRGGTNWSEHARADAIDVAAFRLVDGRRVSVAADWRGGDAAATFLHRVRDGACPLFATVLSPDYNAAHHDHLHLDQAGRGGWGWRACR